MAAIAQLSFIFAIAQEVLLVISFAQCAQMDTIVPRIISYVKSLSNKKLKIITACDNLKLLAEKVESHEK